MDSSAADFKLDEAGICNYCSEFAARWNQSINRINSSEALAGLVKEIKSQGKGKRYDCIVGLSGGVDSSWVVVEAVRLGLKPLAVHMDNGWNSEIAQNNISNIVNGLGIDLHTHVIDWEEYRDLLQAFFDSDVIDLELLYDNAMLAVNYHLARKFDVKYILAGTNQSTEGMAMPRNWNWYKFDARNIKSIAARAGIRKLVTFPCFSTLDRVWHNQIFRIRWVSLLDYIDYNKNESLECLEKRYGYKRYPYKHYESIFTRFYQGYILPKKFRIDKRKLHFSTLIVTNQMTRNEASAKLQSIPYPSEADQNSDIRYVAKKMKWASGKLEEYISRSEIPHDAYPSEMKIANCIEFVKKLVRRHFQWNRGA